jgi:hypothetical protein
MTKRKAPPLLRPGQLLIVTQEQRRSVSPESTEYGTARPCESKSRRWKYVHPETTSHAERVAHIHDRSPSTLATSANSVERTVSSARLSVSGTAALAARPQLEEHTPSREDSPRTVAYLARVEGLRTTLTGNRTPAAAAVRSTTRRLREIAEV